MLKTISPQDMQEMEKAFLDGTGYPSILLMEHAAQHVLHVLTERLPAHAHVLFICGSGNNGGDGCAVARLWIQQGGRASVWLLRSPSQMKGEAGINAQLLNACGAGISILYDETLPEIPSDCCAIVDALYGTGLNRELTGLSAQLVDRINDSGLPVVSVDIPSGIDGAGGQILGTAVRADVTVTFHRAKHGHLLEPGRTYTGELRIEDIGILPDWDGAQGIDVLEAADAQALLPVRPRSGHKGTFGRVLCIAGSEGMAGAAALCASSALRAGAGLVTGACSFPVLMVLQTLAPCATAVVVSDGGFIEESAAGELRSLAEGVQALAIGPGLGRSESTWMAIRDLLATDLPKVVDADALTLLARYGGRVGANTVMTPHPGEMARLCGTTTKEIQSAPVEYAQQLSAQYECCVLLKGSTTVIVQGEETTLNITGCEAMGTGGSGDVLTGVIAGLLAQGMNALDAARVGAYYHGRAGEEAKKKWGSRAVTAWEIRDALRIGEE